MSRLNLQKREKLAVAAVGILAIVLLLQFVARPPLEKYRTVKRAAAVARANLSTARMQRDQIVGERQSAEALRKHIAGTGQGDLASLVSRQLTQAGLLQDKRATWRVDPRFASQEQFKPITITLNGVTLEEIVNLLHNLYSSGNVIVTQSMRVEPSSDGTGLQCRMVLLSPQV